jgi:carbonic anhydrase
MPSFCPRTLLRRLSNGAAWIATAAGLATGLPAARAQDHAATHSAAEAVARNPPPYVSPAKAIGQQVRAALESGVVRDKQLTVDIRPPARTASTASAGKPVNSKASRQYIRARAAALAGRAEPQEEIIEPAHGMGEAHWEYEGVNGPQAWGRLKPEYAMCGLGKRQSPINIDESITLRGPAEAIGFDYNTSSATVVNNGHTIQVDVTGDNGIIVRGSRFQLIQLHFHHPSEEQVNFRRFAMVVHLVHRNYLGQLAVVAVLLDPGPANAVINNFWTYMPLGKGDRVPMPRGSVDLAGLLPKDQRYYQFMGSLTTPPCTEDVLWLVLKQPISISHEQQRLFAQQFPNNARPPQPINGRVVRDAQ